MTDLIYMTLSASAAIILVCIVRKLFGSRLPKSCFPVLWGIIILRMLIPFSVRINLPAPTESTVSEGIYIYTTAVNETAETLTPDDIIHAVYIIGIIASLGITTASHLKNRAVYSCALPCTDENILAAAEKFKLHRKVRIKVSDRVISPFTYGIARPVIVLPAKGIDSENIDAVLSHEMNHIRSYDVLLKKLALFAACIHWFNPLAWVMLVLTDRDIELACDEAVILSGCSRKRYACALLNMAEKGALPYAAGFSIGKNAFSKRITEIIRMKETGKASLACAVLLAMTVSAVFITAEETPYAVYITDGTAVESAYDSMGVSSETSENTVLSLILSSHTGSLSDEEASENTAFSEDEYSSSEEASENAAFSEDEYSSSMDRIFRMLNHSSSDNRYYYNGYPVSGLTYNAPNKIYSFSYYSSDFFGHSDGIYLVTDGVTVQRISKSEFKKTA